MTTEPMNTYIRNDKFHNLHKYRVSYQHHYIWRITWLSFIFLVNNHLLKLTSRTEGGVTGRTYTSHFLKTAIELEFNNQQPPEAGFWL
jgi:hypothetical protein